MKPHLIVSRLTGTDPIVVLSVDGLVTSDMHQELQLFAPALVAVLGMMKADAWYDDEDHSITVKRDLGAPPRTR